VFAAQLRAFALAPMLSGAMSVFCAMSGRFLLTCNATMNLTHKIGVPEYVQLT